MSRKYDNAGFRLNEKQYILTVIAVENVNEIYWPMSDSILSLRDAGKKKCHKVNKKHYLENKVESHVKVTVHTPNGCANVLSFTKKMKLHPLACKSCKETFRKSNVQVLTR